MTKKTIKYLVLELDARKTYRYQVLHQGYYLTSRPGQIYNLI